MSLINLASSFMILGGTYLLQSTGSLWYLIPLGAGILTLSFHGFSDEREAILSADAMQKRAEADLKLAKAEYWRERALALKFEAPLPPGGGKP